MKLQREEILRIITVNRDAIRASGARRLALFGSAARGEASEGSDVDFVVELERKTFDSYMDVKELLEKLLDRPVDLVMVDAIKPRLRASIERDLVHVPGLEFPRSAAYHQMAQERGTQDALEVPP